MTTALLDQSSSFLTGHPRHEARDLAGRRLRKDDAVAVSAKYGHTRVGPKRSHLPRHVYRETERLKRDLEIAQREIAELKGTPKPRF